LKGAITLGVGDVATPPAFPAGVCAGMLARLGEIPPKPPPVLSAGVALGFAKPDDG